MHSDLNNPKIPPSSLAELCFLLPIFCVVNHVSFQICKAVFVLQVTDMQFSNSCMHCLKSPAGETTPVVVIYYSAQIQYKEKKKKVHSFTMIAVGSS